MKQLYRSNEHKVIAGVCGGLGEYFDISPKIFRVLFIVGLFFGFFPSIIVYSIFWVLVDPSPLKKGDSKTTEGKVVDVDPLKKAE